jgi:zinc protease
MKTFLTLPTLMGLAATVLFAGNAGAADYAVVVSTKTKADPGWSQVVSALVGKHQAVTVTFASSVDEALPQLKALFPRYACFVAQPEEATRQFVGQVHRLTRRLDDDPYADCFWGILTGYDATNALRIATVKEPLTIRKAAAGTSIPLQLFEQGVWYCELKKNRMVRKEPGQAPAEERGPDDTTKALVDLLASYQADLFVTSGHATERDWQIGYGYRNGSFRCEHGRLYGRDAAGQRYPIESPNPKVYMAVGNCLMGHIDNRDAMALAYMNSAGVAQMIGYTVNTWYGYAGWGCLDYFVEQPARFTLNEAFFANQHALIYRLATFFPDLLSATIDENGRTSAELTAGPEAAKAGLKAQDARGLLYDRDVLAFYGDPAWEAKLAKTETGWDQNLTHEGDVWTLEVKPRRGARSFTVLDANGSQRNDRPLIQFLPRRVKPAQVIEGADLKPLITDNFVLVPIPRPDDASRNFRLVFRASPLEAGR